MTDAELRGRLRVLGEYCAKHEGFAEVVKRKLDRLGGTYWASVVNNEIPVWDVSAKGAALAKQIKQESQAEFNRRIGELLLNAQSLMSMTGWKRWVKEKCDLKLSVAQRHIAFARNATTWMQYV